MSKPKNKKKNMTPDRPVEAIVTPIAHDEKTGMTIPGVENVRRAKHYVDENKK